MATTSTSALQRAHWNVGASSRKRPDFSQPSLNNSSISKGILFSQLQLTSITRAISYPKLQPPTSRSLLNSSFLPHPSLLVCRSTPSTEPFQETEAEPGSSGGQIPPSIEDYDTDGGGSGGAMDRFSSVFIFAIWAGFIAYCAFLSPNQTPALDQFFLQKFLNLSNDDGFEMNLIMTCLWYIMGLWPAIYAMLLIPTGRSSNNKVPIWPFTTLSIFVGTFALLPYFGLWQPPSPQVSTEEMEGWPLRILDSKILSIIVAIAGLGLIGVAATAGGESWTEYMRFYRSSRFIHIMSLDFFALSFLAPFWVFNDMEVRKWSNGANWAPALAFVPFLGPALYLILRPSLSPDEAE